MVKCIRTDSGNQDFVELVQLLDAELAIADGDLHDFYHQFNGIDHLKYVVVAYVNGNAVGCGAFKPYSNDTVEIKRMYTLPEYRGKGIASAVLSTLESWAIELKNTSALLETGTLQHEALIFYPKAGYGVIPNYGQYEGVENSICFEKKLVD